MPDSRKRILSPFTGRKRQKGRGVILKRGIVRIIFRRSMCILQW